MSDHQADKHSHPNIFFLSLSFNIKSKLNCNYDILILFKILNILITHN